MSNKRRWLKKLLAIPLCVALLFGTLTAMPVIIPGSVPTASAASWSVTEVPEGYTPIYTATDLNNIRSNATNGQKYILMNNIDLSQTEWKTIPVFNGTLDGNGYKIINFHQSGDRSVAGFIDTLSANGTNQASISHLTFENVQINFNYVGGQYQQYYYISPLVFGVICNHVRSGGIAGCSVSGSINVNIDDASQTMTQWAFAASYAGGIVGENGGRVLSSHNHANIAVNVNSTGLPSLRIGGVCGYSKSQCEYKDGIINSIPLRNCSNTGSISTNYPATVGGITGYGSAAVCYNTGNISTGSLGIAGGISGLITGSSGFGDIYNCYNTGTISGSSRIGGIIGEVCAYRYVNHYSTQYQGDSHCDLSHVANFADGGIYGSTSKENESADVYCLNVDGYTIDNTTFGQGGTPLTPEQIKQRSSYQGFDFSSIWEMTPDGSRAQLRHPREITAVSMEITQMPSKTVYHVGDEFEASGQLTVQCSNGNSAVIDITEDMLSGYDMNTVGTQTVTVSYYDLTTSYEIIVKELEPTGISLNESSITLDVGDSYTGLSATVYPSNAPDKTVTWTTSNSDIATVSDGTITAVSAGTAVITAETVNGKKAICLVTVKGSVVEAASIELNKASVVLDEGCQETLTATITPQDTTDKTVTWQSSNEQVATVENGTITAVSSGTAIITAKTSNNKTAFCTVTVAVPVSEITLNNSETTINQGDTVTLRATITPSDATNQTVTWTTSDSSVATVSNGTVTAVAPGTATITATTANGKTATCTVTVIIPESGITLNKTDITINQGETETLSATITPSNATNKTVTWTTSDSNVATVLNGKVTAVAPGTATITAETSNGKTATCTVTVIIPESGITLNKTETTINQGDTVTLSATITPSNATNKTVTWTTSDSSVVTVSNGKVTAVEPGTSTITATTANGKTATCTVTVIIPESGITLNKTDITINQGKTETLSATITPSDATNQTVTWTSSNSSVATVSNGKITAVAAGTATITAKSNNGKTATCTVTVVNPTVDVTGISLNKTSTTISKGGSETLTATITPSNATNKTVTWATSNSSVATVSNGKITAVAAGTATITAKSNNGKTATCTVTVVNPTVDVTGISLNKTSTTISKGGSETLTATITPSNATNKTVTWTSSNSSVATVSNGKITAVAAGTATITAKSNNGKTATCSVTVTNPTVAVTGITLNKTSTTITKGNTETLTATITPSNATNKTVIWTTNNSSVATVSSGKVTAVAAGTATITAKSNNGKTATCSVTVTNPTVAVTGITLNKTSTTITKGNTETLTATITPSNATNKTITWTTSNSSVATVSSGKVTAVAAGTATITAKSNSGKTATCTVTVVAPISKFEWNKDNWNFKNSSSYFGSTTYRKQINSEYLKKLKSNLTNSEYQTVFLGSWYSGPGWLDDKWGGSCYGMSSTTLLAKNGLLPYSKYKSGATKLYDLYYPLQDSNTSSLITYYQMLQVKDGIQRQYRIVPYRSHETNIKNIIELLKTNSTVVVGFRKTGWGGHAILAYDYEYGSFTFDGVTYQGCIKICDPNFSSAYDKTANIYFNTSTYSWTIPAYKNSGISSAKGATFNYVGADVSEINEGGYLSSSSPNNTTGDFVARIDAREISNNRSVCKVQYENGSYINHSSGPDEIIEDYSYVLTGESEGMIGYNLYDPDSAYKVSQENADTIELKMDYQLCDLTGYSAAGKSITFDKSGSVIVEGESADYNMSMTFDHDYPTEWFSIQVSGSNANLVSLSKTSEGYIIRGNNLQNVQIKTNNMSAEATLKFNTTYDEVLVYEIDPNTIGLKVDTDNNGTFETELDTTQPLKNTSKVTASSITKGKSVTVKASSTGGVGTKKYAVWYKQASASSWSKARDYATGTTITFTPKHTGKYNVSVKVKDAEGTIKKKALTVTVNSALSNTSTLSASTITKGKSVTVKASSTGGVGTKKYAVWYKQASASSWTKARDYATGTTITFTPKHTGKYNVSVKVKDAEGTIKKKALTVTVNSALSNTSTLSASTITKGKSVTVKASSTGGVGTKKYAVWYKQASASSWSKARDYATGTTITFTPKHTGKYNVSVKAKDAEGTIKKKAFTITVAAS